MSDIPEPREPAQYGNVSENDRYEKHGKGGAPDPEANIDRSAERPLVECPRCGCEYRNLPIHLRTCDGTAKE